MHDMTSNIDNPNMYIYRPTAVATSAPAPSAPSFSYVNNYAPYSGLVGTSDLVSQQFLKDFPEFNLNTVANQHIAANPPPGLATKLRDFNSQYGSTIMSGLQAAGGLWGAYNGMQQNKLVKQQMANSLNQWNKNYANQLASYNTRLEDRQNARVAAQGTKYHQDTASYMEKNRLK